ncbi:MAG: hypothetical protein KDB03_03030 [Planctomycetales bacterium]|nr:hypothetical protein [Planctomycetales bacterium]
MKSEFSDSVAVGEEVFNIPTVQSLRLDQVAKVHSTYLRQFPGKRESLERLLSVRLSPDDSTSATDDFIPSSDDARVATSPRQRL